MSFCVNSGFAKLRDNIGSGMVESGVNTVIHHRLKRQSRAWERHNAQAMVAGLSELHSGRFQVIWLSLARSQN